MKVLIVVGSVLGWAFIVMPVGWVGKLGMLCSGNVMFEPIPNVTATNLVVHKSGVARSLLALSGAGI
jgi:hypothetical protein